MKPVKAGRKDLGVAGMMVCVDGVLDNQISATELKLTSMCCWSVDLVCLALCGAID